jgi:hypothetical protein
MTTITHPGLLKFKGILFLVLGLLGAGLLLLDSPRLSTLALLALTIWAFCRFYYFAFYVLQQYADPNFRYTGLCDLARYLLFKKR